jgi:hypothetical protein
MVITAAAPIKEVNVNDMSNNSFEDDKAFGPNESDNSAFESALKYIRLDLSVIPIFRPGQTNYSGEVSNGKDPAIPKVEPYRDKLEELKKWFANGSKHNIAILTGKPSNVIALDIDGENSKRDFQDVIKTFSKNLQIAIDNTMRIRTGGNAHLILRYDPNDFPNALAKQDVLLELRAFFLNVINDAYTKHYKTFTDKED